MDEIEELFYSIWDAIRKFFLRIISFVRNIKNFFLRPEMKQYLRNHRNIKALSIKESLDNGDYAVCNCLFDMDTSDIVSFETAEGLEASDMDEETQEAFGDKRTIMFT